MAQLSPPSHLTRKWRKLRSDPVRFFADAKSPLVRQTGLWGMAILNCVFDWTVVHSVSWRVAGIRKSGALGLKPNADLQETDVGWTCVGDTPRFDLAGTPRLVEGTWIHIELSSTGRDLGTWLEPVLTATNRRGETLTLAGLPAIREGHQRTMVRVPQHVVSLSLIPMPGAIEFSMPEVRIRPIARLLVLRSFLRNGHSLPAAMSELLDRQNARKARQIHSATNNMERGRDILEIRESELFDSKFYLSTYNDVSASGLDPAEHYYRFGAREGRNTSPYFDTEQYLRENPDVKLAGINPLLHYLRYGKDEKWRVPWQDMPPAPKPKVPANEDWDRLELRMQRRKKRSLEVDVVIPVYRGYNDTLACIYSVLNAKVRTGFELVVINDCSPEPDLVAELERLAYHGLFTLFQNLENLGFVRTVNRGISLHHDRDVVILNSDTVVYGNWLDRLRRHTGRDPLAGTVSPLSNNATICSYPITNRNNFTALEVPFDELDKLAAKANKGKSVAAPTGVGFCLYIRRSCLKEVGLFDAKTFGHGYGEENDFCQRALKYGWRNLVAGDVFVRHSGEVSFGETAGGRKRNALRLLSKRHPNYLQQIDQFIAEDPLAPLRHRLDIARVRPTEPNKGTVLIVTHSRGGGIERHIRDTAETLSVGGIGVLLLRSNERNKGEASLDRPDRLFLPNLNPIRIPKEVDRLIEALRACCIDRIQVHSLADYPDSMPRLIPLIASRLGVTYEFMMHDYLPICPRTNLIDQSGIYCGEKGEAACRDCLSKNPVEMAQIDIATWRRAYGKFLDGAEIVYAPSTDTAQRITRYFPNLEIIVKPHDEHVQSPPRYRLPRWKPGEMVRVAIIGAIGPHKGSNVLLQCARDAINRNLSLEYIVIGFTDSQQLIQLPNVTITGRYIEAEVFDLIAQHRCHVAFLPSVWPETYSYTLSIAIAAGLSPVVFDIGAPAERLSNVGSGKLLPMSAIKAPRIINEYLLFCGRDTISQNPDPTFISSHVENT